MKTYGITFSTVILSLLLASLSIKAQLINTYSCGKEEITAFAYAKDAGIIALGSKTRIELLKAETFQKISSHDLTSGVTSLVINADGRFLVFSSSSSDKAQNLIYWDIERGNRSPVHHSHDDRIVSIALSPDGNWMATGSRDKTIKIFDTRTLNEIYTLLGHNGEVTSLCFSSDSKFLISGSKDRTMILWDFMKGVDLHQYIGHSKKVNSVAFSHDSRLLASASDDKTIRIWEADNPEKSVSILNSVTAVTSVEFTPDGRFLGSAMEDNQFYIWKLKDNSLVDLNLGNGVQHTDIIRYLKFADNGKLYTCADDHSVKYWNWGFPILAISNFRIEDANGNYKIEGTEKVSILFDLENSGDGDALKMRFNINEIRKIDGLDFPSTHYIEEIPARSKQIVEIKINPGARLKNSIALFSFEDFRIFNNMPFLLNDTTFRVETIAAPQLVVDTVMFIYSDTSQVLTGKQNGRFKLEIRNIGVGIAKNVEVNATSDKSFDELEYESHTGFGHIAPMASQVLYIPVKATAKAENGQADFSFRVTEASGISTVEGKLTIKLRKYEPTLIEEIRQIVESRINEWQKKGKWEQTEEYKNRVTEKTRENQIVLYTQHTIDSLVKKDLNWSLAVNDYDADNESFKISIPKFDPVYLKVPRAEAPEFDKKFKQLKIGDISYTVSDNMKNFAFLHFELIDTLAQNKSYLFNSTESIAFNTRVFNFNFDPINVNIATNSTNTNSGEVINYSLGKSDVDVNIPEIAVEKPNVFAVVIGNEDYSSRQKGLNTEVNVDYAINDAVSFKTYLASTYGIPDENIKLYTNATAAEIDRGIKWLKSLAESRKGEAELVFYFSGHGLPDEQTREGYIMPVDVTGTDIQFAIKLSYLYAELSKYPSKKVTVILDACFSGGGRTQGLMAMKGAKVKPREESISSNMVVFTSSSGDESSGFYREKQHGLFTYYLLKKIQETKGEVDYQSLIDYLKEKVNVQSLISNFKNQNPQLIISSDFTKPLNMVRLGSENE
ncbi:MAG: caspase family protein [Bacteroidales bacterium]|nr:caspase family protein [Bacteroidales bacterium]